MKHDPKTTAHAAAATVAGIYVVCATAFVLLPDLTMSVARSWFHGIDIGGLAASQVTVDSFILGIISAIALAWLVGYAFATLYNYFLKK